MRVTDNLKNRLVKAKCFGYEEVAVTTGVVGKWGAHDIAHYSIDKILSMPVGSSFRATFSNNWHGINKRAIQYQQLFNERRFSE